MISLFILAAVLHVGLLEEVAEPFQVPDVCTETGPELGSCGDYMERWFFNPDDNQCKQFKYSGCGGNQNNFQTREQCENVCIGRGTGETPDESTNEDSSDVLAPEAVSSETETTGKSTEQSQEAASETETTQTEKGTNVEEEEEDDDDGLSDGEEDDEILRTYMNMGGDISPEDSEMIKEAMSAYEVSILKTVDDPEEEEDDASQAAKPQIQEQVQQHEENPTNDNNPIQHKVIPEVHAESMSKNEQTVPNPDDDADEDEDEDDGFIDDNGKDVDLFLDNIGDSASPEDREILLESIAEFGATGMKDVDEIEDGMEIVPFSAEQPSEASHDSEGSAAIKEANVAIEAAQTEANEAKRVMENVQVAINPIEPVQEGAGDGSDDAEDDEEPEGIDLDIEYPALHGIISPEDQQTLTDAMSVFDVAEAVTDGREITEEILAELPVNMDYLNEMQKMEKVKAEAPAETPQASIHQEQVAAEATVEAPGFVDMNDDDSDDDDADEEDPVDEILNHERDAIFKTEQIDNPQDRFLLSELVSQYDVAVMEEKDRQEIDSKSTESDQMGQSYNPGNNRLTPIDGGLLPPRCTMPADTGPCRARKLKWFFDMETGKCNTFIYGGCQGNSNRFRSRGKCSQSCLGLRRQRYGKPNTSQRESSIDDVPTRSPTQKITFMMPFMKDQSVSKPDFIPMQRQKDVPRHGLTIRNIREQVSTALTTLSQGFGRPQMSSDVDELRPPFSPLRFMLMRALARPKLPQGKLTRPPTPTPPPPPQRLPFGPRIRIMLPRPRPAQLPFIHTQQSIPNLMPARALPTPARPVKIPMMNRMPPFPLDEQSDKDEQNRENGYSIFTPRFKNMKKIKSANHDNRHLNNVSPSNKFTLLQVFVNKPHGGMSPMNTMQRPRVSATLKKPPPPPPVAKSNPFNPMMMQSARNNRFPPFMMHSMNPNHISAPFMHAPMPHPPMPHHHHHESFHSHNNDQIHRPFRPSFPLMRNPFNNPSRRPLLKELREPVRRPHRPIVVVTEQEEEEEYIEQTRYNCLLPLAPGRCKSYHTKWYYNQDSNTCEIFYFTGCGGNGNNFETWEECAALCLDVDEGPRTTLPIEDAEEESRSTEEMEEEIKQEENEMVEEEEEEEEEEDEGVDKRPDTIIMTSTVFPETEEEAQKAAEEAAAGVKELPSVEELRKTTETPETDVKLAPKDELQHAKEVISETGHLSMEYIILLTVMAVVASAVIVILTLTIVHIRRRSQTSKKEQALEAVINKHLYGDLPQVVYTVKSAAEAAEKTLP